MFKKLSSLDIFKIAAICTIAGIFITLFQAVYPVWHDRQNKDMPGPGTHLRDIVPGPNPLGDTLDKDYQNYQNELKHGSSLPFLRTYAPGRYTAWLQDAEKGEAIAELFVARCYNAGIAVTKNNATALKWATLSADQGNTFAMNLVGLIYDSGGDVAKDHATAMQWYRKAADRGNWIAMYNLGTLYDDDESYPEAMQWYRKAADAGYAEAMRHIGVMYAYGHGVPKDPAQAMQWYHKAADAGDSNAVGLVMAERIEPAFKSYADKDATEASKALALTTIRGTLSDFKALDLVAADAVLQNGDIKGAVDKLHEDGPTNPLLAVYGEMVERYINLYQQASLDTKATFAGSFAGFTADLVDKWFTDGKYDAISTFWKKNYQELPISTLTAGEKNSLIRQLNRCVSSLLKTGDRKEGKQLLNDALALCDGILAEKPWDWYTKDAYSVLCFDSAAALSELGDTIPVQPLLRRGWSVIFKEHGKEDIMGRYTNLPLKGQVPDGATADDTAFFKKFAPGAPVKDSDEVMFTIPVEFDGTKYPFKVYVISGQNGYAELQDQFRWLKEMRGLTIPTEVRDSFMRLNKIAVDNKVNFMDLCVYAMGTDNKKK